MKLNSSRLRPPWPRPGLTVRLFFAVLAVAVLVAVMIGLAAQLGFHRGFLGYLNRQAVERMEAAVPRLREAHAEHGSWDFVAGRPGAWFRLVENDLPRGDPHQELGAIDTAQLAPSLLGYGRRLTLLDAQRQHVIGFPRILANSEEREIVDEAGRTLGWIVLAPVQSVTDAAALRFQSEQLRATLVAAVLALLLAALVAWWVARALLAPVREVAQATHRLAAGHHDTRVEVRGQDEVGRLAQDFNLLAQTLERNERLRREAMADISHELRTPLAVLRGEIEAMQDGIHPLTPQALGLLHGKVSALTRLVDDLHQLALADVGALRLRHERLDLAALVRAQTEAFAARCAERRLRLIVDLPEAAATPLLLADADRLGQLLHNLLDNAVRYTDPGGELRVALAHDPAAAQLLLTVEDSAPGVAPELLPRLFERFFRVESSRGRAGGGSGLGLAICRSLVEAHGGRIHAEASPLGGLRIGVALPLAALQAQ
ncbi:ATP-binding protein (plasmid) [Sphaerotilus natans]|uniref:ATP-binding protein n=1 Tax=Sphaerotilus natans TaxID=34103 RepID=UPI00406D46EE